MKQSVNRTLQPLVVERQECVALRICVGLPENEKHGEYGACRYRSFDHVDCDGSLFALRGPRPDLLRVAFLLEQLPCSKNKQEEKAGDDDLHGQKHLQVVVPVILSVNACQQQLERCPDDNQAQRIEASGKVEKLYGNYGETDDGRIKDL